MKIRTLLLISILLGSLGLGVTGCDSETHPDPHLVESMNSQRQAQQPGQTPANPPTGQGK
jgi:hypothetical protein